MSRPPAPLHRGPLERARCWLVCGPLGHLWSAIADLALFGLRSAMARAGLR